MSSNALAGDGPDAYPYFIFGKWVVQHLVSRLASSAIGKKHCGTLFNVSYPVSGLVTGFSGSQPATVLFKTDSASGSQDMPYKDVFPSSQVSSPHNSAPWVHLSRYTAPNFQPTGSTKTCEAQVHSEIPAAQPIDQFEV